jgi:hypothetical protein
MIDGVRRMASFVVGAFAVATLSLSGCYQMPAACPCTGLPAAHVAIPMPDAALAVIVSVATDPPCVAEDDGTFHVSVSRQLPGRCDVLVRLSNNDIFTFSVEFQAAGQGGCCPDFPYPADASSPVLYDAGAGGG